MRQVVIGFLVAGIGTAFGSTILVSTPGAITSPSTGTASTNIVNWAQLGKNGAAIVANFSATSSGGTLVDGGLGGAAGGTVVDACTNSASCWVPDGGIAANDALVSTDKRGVGDGPLTLTFGSTAGVANSIYGAGAYVQSSAAGEFIAEIAVYSGTSLVASNIVFSDGGGDPLFLGAMDTTPGITKIVIAMLGTSDFVVDSLYLSAPGSAPPVTQQAPATFTPADAAPEPAMFPLMGIALAGLFMAFKKRTSRI